jgi:hypothetical protein
MIEGVREHETVDVSTLFNSGDSGPIELAVTTGNDQRVSIVDFMIAVTGLRWPGVCVILKNLEESHPDFFESLQEIKLMGVVKFSVSMLCLSECVALMEMFPDGTEFRAEFRKNPTELLTRLFANDPTIILVKKLAIFESRRMLPNNE